jgi:hypothetical protein
MRRETVGPALKKTASIVNNYKRPSVLLTEVTNPGKLACKSRMGTDNNYDESERPVVR